MRHASSSCGESILFSLNSLPSQPKLDCLAGVTFPALHATGPRLAFFTMAILAMAHAARASDGSHIIDDSEVVAPGTCQISNAVTQLLPGGGAFDTTNVCTLQSLPRLQFGLGSELFWGIGGAKAAQHLGASGQSSTAAQQQANSANAAGLLLGPAVKVNLIPEKTGVGMALDHRAGINVATGGLSFATLIVPVTIPLNDKVRFNLNAGWNYSAAAAVPNALFYGAQAEAKVGWDVRLMVDIFGLQPGVAGAQIGLRWRQNNGPVTYDLLTGGLFESNSPRFFTMGVTVRY